MDLPGSGIRQAGRSDNRRPLFRQHSHGCFGLSPDGVSLAFPAMDSAQGVLHSGTNCTGNRLTGGTLMAQI
jgi:hypothetical protein